MMTNITKMKTNFETCDINAKIHGLSILVGELYAEMYASSPGMNNMDQVDNALEAFKSLRRMLPTVFNEQGIERHQGHRAAHYSTQGA